jgi:hypothetical protein
LEFRKKALSVHLPFHEVAGPACDPNVPEIEVVTDAESRLCMLVIELKPQSRTKLAVRVPSRATAVLTRVPVTIQQDRAPHVIEPFRPAL